MRLGAQKVADAAGQELQPAGHVDLARFDPGAAARVGAVTDAVGHGAQRHLGTVRERQGIWQGGQPVGYPVGVIDQKRHAGTPAGSRRQRDDDRALARVDAQADAAGTWGAPPSDKGLTARKRQEFGRAIFHDRPHKAFRAGFVNHGAVPGRAGQPSPECPCFAATQAPQAILHRSTRPGCSRCRRRTCRGDPARVEADTQFREG